MKKMIFVIVVVLAVIMMMAPANRERVMGWVSSISSAGGERSTMRQLEQIAALLASSARASGVYPQAGSLELWLTQRDWDGTDSWGSAYYIEVYADSFVVGSRGADKRLRTDDDVRLARSRTVPEPGVLIVDYQPAPPPSSTGSKAKSKALEAAGRQ